MDIKTAELPGIGKKISFHTSENSMIVLIIHHSGKRDLYFFEDADSDEADFFITLNGEETRQLGAQLLGAIYQPVDTDKMKMFQDKILIEWIELSTHSSLVNKSIGDSQIRTRTGASIIGIVKGENTIAVPDIDVVLQPGDVLMTLGKKEQIATFAALCKGEDQG